MSTSHARAQVRAKRSIIGDRGLNHEITITETAMKTVNGIITSTVTAVRSGSSSSRFTSAEASGPPIGSSDKSAWRRWAIGLPPPGSDAVAAVQEAIAAVLDEDAVVLTFLSMPGEIAPSLPATGTVLITRTPPTGPLTVHRHTGDLELHRFGFLQPGPDAPVWDGPIDVALVPGLAFGRDGTRLGRGAGYYDRLLAERPVPMRVGVTRTATLVDTVPAEVHDVPMTHIATEGGVITVRQR